MLVFPLLSLMACVLVIASFAWLSGSRDTPTGSCNSPVAEGVGRLGHTIRVLRGELLHPSCSSNAALVAGALIRLRGGDPTLADGFRAAVSRLPQILAWTLVSATVGMLLKMADRKADAGRAWLSACSGVAWSVATFFVVRGTGRREGRSWDALKRSAKVISDSWGEAFVADLGIGLIGGLASIPAYALMWLGGMSPRRSSPFKAYCSWRPGSPLIIVALVTSALEMIARAGLYMQAVA